MQFRSWSTRAATCILVATTAWPVAWTQSGGQWQVTSGTIPASHYDAVASGPVIAGTSIDFKSAFIKTDIDDYDVEFLPKLGPNPIETFATDVNESGHVVGVARRTGVPPTYSYWTGGIVTDVGVQAPTPAGMSGLWGSLSNLGRIAGVNGATSRAFTKRNGVVHTLPLPANGALSWAEDVNTCGTIAGWVIFNDFSTRAVIWNRYNGNQLLCDN